MPKPKVKVKGRLPLYLGTAFWVVLVVSSVVFGGILLVGLVQSMLPRPPLTVEECRERIACLDYLAAHDDVAQSLVLEVHAEVLLQSEPRNTSASRQVGDATISYGGFWSPDGIPENLWDRIFTVESEEFSCRVEVNSMYANVEDNGLLILLAQERTLLENRITSIEQGGG